MRRGTSLQSRMGLHPAACPMCKHGSAGFLWQAPDRFHGRLDVYTLLRCTSCGLVWLAEPPPPQDMPFHYGREYHRSIDIAANTDVTRRWRRHRDTVLRLKEGGTLLDIGCSSGAFLQTLKGTSWQLHGIEISETEAERARTLAAAEVFTGDPLKAPYQSSTFDIITCFHLLEHVYDPMTLLARIHAWLKPGGFLYVIVPNVASWEALLFRSFWYGLELPRHLFHFTPSSLQRAVHSAHMDTVILHTLVEDSFAVHSVRYLLAELLCRWGVEMAPLSAGLPASLPLKVIRKLFRLFFETPFRVAAAATGRGASIEGIFRKTPIPQRD